MKPEELLYKEKLCLLSYLKSRKFSLPEFNDASDAKNAEMSVKLRKEGNALYTDGRLETLLQLRIRGSDEMSNLSSKIWQLYTESIIFAPNNSEELALAYGNISAYFLRLSIFNSCIEVCDQALRITSCDFLKLKLLYRKAKSLHMLNKSPKVACCQALRLLDKLMLDEKIRKDYVRNLTALHRKGVSASDKCKSCHKKHYNVVPNELLDFERSQEVPYAAKSVAIQYSKKWGRHIVATEDIQPGEIIAVENYCINFPQGVNKYRFCANCMNFIFMYAVIPCEYCTVNVYCSESCRKEMWEKFHQFECNIFIKLKFTKVVLLATMLPLRLCLLGVSQAGGLKQMKEQLLEIENTKDARTKGFSNGIFPEKVKSILSLQYHTEQLEVEYNSINKLINLENTCLSVYSLAKFTNFFGEKINLAESKMFLNQDILFIAALFLRVCLIAQVNTKQVSNEKGVIGIHLQAFGSLFNHSCDPNVSFCPIKSSQNIYYARYPIKKGSQLFLVYNSNSFLSRTKGCRQTDLEILCNFTCNCLACKENWSDICLPSLKVVLKIVPSLRTSMLTDIAKIDLLQVVLSDASVSLKREQILLYMKLLSKHFTVYCEEYHKFLEYLEHLYTSL